MKNVVILGSSRKGGNTKSVVEKLKKYLDFDLIDLKDYKINHYNYEHDNDDDFLKLIIKIIKNYETIIFATPVYWYSMSGIMKVFFDRITDLLDTEKDLCRKLRDKNMAVLSSSVGDNLDDHFWLPFIETAKYLGMNYVGNVHTIEKQAPENKLREFSSLLK